MGVFATKIAKSKAAFGANYGREGRYWVILNGAKMDTHATKGTEQFIVEGTVVHIVDPGPPAGQRFKPTKGGNEAPHNAGDPYTFHFGMWQPGAEGRAKKLLLVADNTEEAKLPAAINPLTGQPAPVPPGAPIPGVVHPQTGGPVLAVDPVEFAVEMSVNPNVNALRDIVIEVHGRGQRTQGRNGQPPQDIIATDPVRRVWAKEIHDIFDKLHANAQLELRKDGRIDRALARESSVRNLTQK